MLFLSMMATLFSCISYGQDSAFLSASFWDDGKAEVSVYDAKRKHYGRLYSAKIEYFLVKENFSLDNLVKTERADDPNTVRVIKLNQVIATPTGTYDYQQMHSAFWSKQSGELLKFSMSHHEACGSSYKQGTSKKSGFSIEGFTYWEGQSRINEHLARSPKLWFYDELPFKARVLVADRKPAPATIQLVPGTIHSKAGDFRPGPATLTIDDFTVTLTHSGGEDILTFDREWPHVMRSWRQADGGSLDLVKSQRLDYWNHHSPGDEHLLD